MRKLLLFVVILGCCLCPQTVFAEGECWARITREDTYLYATEDCSKQMFMLEKSYYVQILESLDKTYFVKVDCQDKNFPPLCGYVLKNQVRVCDDLPIAPLYPTEKLVVNGNSATLRLSPTPSAEVVLVATNTQTVCYYGNIVAYGLDWYYVYFAGQFGYILAEQVTSPKISLHPTPIEVPQNTPTITPPTDQPSQVAPETFSPTAEIILTVFVSLVALAITFSLFLPVKSKKQLFDGDI